MWVKGSGSDLATMGPEHFTGAQLDEVLPLFERDEMSDEDMVAYLRALPARPRDAALLDRDAAARVRPGAARPPHPPGRHQRAGRQRRRRAARRGVLRRRGGLDPLHPPRLHALQAGRRGRARQPGAEARRARQARARGVGRQRRGGVPEDDRGHQPGGRVRQRAHRRHRALRRPRTPRRRRAKPELLQRAAAHDPRRGLEREAQAADRRHVGALARVRVLGRRRAARHRRRALPRPPRPHQAAAAVDPLRPGGRRRRRAARADRRARRRVPRRLPRLRRRFARRLDRAGRPRPAVVLVQHLGLVSAGTTTKNSKRLARPLPPRDRGDGGRPRARRVRLARRRGELRDRVLAARALQARAGAAARRAPGPGRARDRRRGRHRPRDRRRARRRRARASSRSTSTRTAREDAVAGLGDDGLAVSGDVTSEDGVRDGVRRGRRPLRRRRHPRLQRGRGVERGARGHHAG